MSCDKACICVATRRKLGLSAIPSHQENPPWLQCHQSPWHLDSDNHWCVFKTLFFFKICIAYS